jgi:hypothetical protein
MKLNYILTLVLALLVGVLGTLLITQAGKPTGSGVAWGMDSVTAGNLIGLVGDQANFRLPVLLVDTERRVIMAYEYNIAERRLYLTNVRSFKGDNAMDDYPVGWSKPTVTEIQTYVNSLRGGGLR